MMKFIERFLPESMRAPVAAPALRPKVHYETRLIGPDNIREYHDNGIVWACTDIYTGDIYVYNYRLAPGFKLSPTDKVYQTLQKPRQPDRVLAHEMRHITNAVWRKYYALYDTNKYFDMVLLHGLDEISAFTYGETQNGERPATWDDMWDALDAGIDFLTSPNRHYREFHQKIVRDSFDYNNRERTERRQIKTLDKLLSKRTVKFAHSTNVIADYFLTFWDYRILDPKVKMPTYIKNKLRDFREEWTGLARSELMKIRKDLTSR